MRLLIHFARFGPYHLARIESARAIMAPVGWEVIGLETGGDDATYAWREETGSTAFQRVTVFPGETVERISADRIREGVISALDKLRPDAVAIAGWSSTDARACLDWCRKHSTTAIVMSETREVDGTRLWWKEWIKSRIVQRFDAALVGGRSHRNYLVKLGMEMDRIRHGYNVVDNGFFEVESIRWKAAKGEVFPRPRPYFLASNRFIERKNLQRLIEAYGKYLKRSHMSYVIPQWDLCLLGDGALKLESIAQCRALGLIVADCAPWEIETRAESVKRKAEMIDPAIFFPGFRQIEELPKFYALADCFVHPALEEPWGLVINEAMASGLPILSGNNVGAAEELVDAGVNGWTFDAGNVAALTEALTNVAGLSKEARQDMGAASTRILGERCPTQAFGRGLAELLRVD